MLETVERKPEIAPSVTYCPELTNGDLPYRVSINPGECARVLRYLDIPESDISSLRINVLRKPDLITRLLVGPGDGFKGSYEPGNKKVNLYTRKLWERYQAWMGIAQGVVDRKLKPAEGLFRDELYTEKLVDFLVSAPSETAIRTADRLFRKSLQRWFNRTTLHELRHFAQHAVLGNTFRRTHKNVESEAYHFAGDFDQRFPQAAVIEPKTPLFIPSSL